MSEDAQKAAPEVTNVELKKTKKIVAEFKIETNTTAVVTRLTSHCDYDGVELLKAELPQGPNTNLSDMAISKAKVFLRSGDPLLDAAIVVLLKENRDGTATKVQVKLEDCTLEEQELECATISIGGDVFTFLTREPEVILSTVIATLTIPPMNPEEV